MTDNIFALLVDVFQIAASIAVIVTLIYVAKTYNDGKQLEQVKLANDILKDLSQIEEKLIDVPSHRYPQQAKRLWDTIYFNKLDLLAFLVNKKQIRNKRLIDYFINSIRSDYEGIFQKYSTREEKEDDNAYSDLKHLYKEHSQTKNEE